MEANLGIISIVAFCIIGLIVLIILKNRKDKKELIDTLNSDYKKPDEHKRESELSNEEN